MKWSGLVTRGLIGGGALILILGGLLIANQTPAAPLPELLNHQAQLKRAFPAGTPIEMFREAFGHQREVTDVADIMTIALGASNPPNWLAIQNAEGWSELKPMEQALTHRSCFYETYSDLVCTTQLVSCALHDEQNTILETDAFTAATCL